MGIFRKKDKVLTPIERRNNTLSTLKNIAYNENLPLLSSSEELFIKF